MKENPVTIDLGGVNAYLFKGENGYLLFDTGYPGQINKLENALLAQGCHPGQLQLLLLSHGDIDHCGNSVMLRQKFQTQIAMHRGDLAIVETGDPVRGRKGPPDYCPYKFKMMLMISMLFQIDFQCFSPDILVDETYSLASLGFKEQIIHTPGHSSGSISLLDSNQNLYCGDLIYNFFKPELLLIFDLKEAKQSFEKLKALQINMVYPGHGKPFKFNSFLDHFYTNHLKKLYGRYEKV